MRRLPTFRSGDAIAKLENINKSFNGKPIVQNINLTVKKGETLLITGQSGSGKSTILRTIAGLETPDTGTVSIFGRNLYDMHNGERAKWISKYMGVGFQAHNLDTGFSTRDNLESLAEARGKLDHRRLGRIAIALGLQDKLYEEAITLSGGEKQRVALGRMLVPKPDLVLLDEPTAAIDPTGKASIYGILREMSEADGTTLVIVSHDDVARRYADREIIVQSGHIISDGPIQPITPAA